MTDNLWIAGALLTIAIGCYFLGFLHGCQNGNAFRIRESIRLDVLIDWINDNTKVFINGENGEMSRLLLDAYIEGRGNIIAEERTNDPKS